MKNSSENEEQNQRRPPCKSPLSRGTRAIFPAVYKQDYSPLAPAGRGAGGEGELHAADFRPSRCRRGDSMENARGKKLYFISALLCMLVLCACNQKPSSQKIIGVTLLTKEHVFYRDLENGLKDAAREKGFNLLVTSGDWDLAKQQSQIENFIVQKVDAIIVCPVNTKGIGPAIEKASQAKIPVFTADIKAEGGPVIAHVASDNYLGGKLAGEYMVKALNGKGKVAIIDQSIVESAMERVRGFEEVLRQHPDMQIVAKPNGDGVRDRAMKAAEDLLQGNPVLNGIFGINDDSALGALSAIESARRNGIVVIGFDAIPEARAAILRDSSLKADVVQNPKEIGQKTIDTIDRYLKGETVPKLIPVEVKVVDKASLENETTSNKQ